MSSLSRYWDSKTVLRTPLSQTPWHFSALRVVAKKPLDFGLALDPYFLAAAHATTISLILSFWRQAQLQQNTSLYFLPYHPHSIAILLWTLLRPQHHHGYRQQVSRLLIPLLPLHLEQPTLNFNTICWSWKQSRLFSLTLGVEPNKATLQGLASTLNNAGKIILSSWAHMYTIGSSLNFAQSSHSPTNRKLSSNLPTPPKHKSSFRRLPSHSNSSLSHKSNTYKQHQHPRQLKPAEQRSFETLWYGRSVRSKWRSCNGRGSSCCKHRRPSWNERRRRGRRDPRRLSWECPKTAWIRHSRQKLPSQRPHSPKPNPSRFLKLNLRRTRRPRNPRHLLPKPLQHQKRQRRHLPRRLEFYTAKLDDKHAVRKAITLAWFPLSISPVSLFRLDSFQECMIFRMQQEAVMYKQHPIGHCKFGHRGNEMNPHFLAWLRPESLQLTVKAASMRFQIYEASFRFHKTILDFTSYRYTCSTKM